MHLKNPETISLKQIILVTKFYTIDCMTVTVSILLTSYAFYFPSSLTKEPVGERCPFFVFLSKWTLLFSSIKVGGEI